MPTWKSPSPSAKLSLYVSSAAVPAYATIKVNDDARTASTPGD